MSDEVIRVETLAGDVLGPETLRAIEDIRSRRERINGRRLWAVFMVAGDLETAESIIRGRPVMACLLDAEALRRARRGAPAPAPDAFFRVRDGHLDAISEAGPLRPKSKGRR